LPKNIAVVFLNSPFRVTAGGWVGLRFGKCTGGGVDFFRRPLEKTPTNPKPRPFVERAKGPRGKQIDESDVPGYICRSLKQKQSLTLLLFIFIFLFFWHFWAFRNKGVQKHEKNK
jgi:hypothetical protein